jgi:predicted DCC family thiol-disulfide oxidoreductase YuxK
MTAKKADYSFSRENNAVILFDGICNFCNSSVNFIIERDFKNRFKFAALQSPIGKGLLDKFNLNTENLKTIILIENEKYLYKNNRSFEDCKTSKGLLEVDIYIYFNPPFLRNIVYSIIAKYRYSWFGKKNSCRIPTPEEKEKFLV